MFLAHYLNGNRMITIDENGTKRRFKKSEDNSQYLPEFPENIDMNISYNCENNCSFCYINAEVRGKIALDENISKIKKLWQDLPKGIEVAINFNTGEENSIVLAKVVHELNKVGAIVNVTSNINNDFLFLKSLQDQNLIHGIGISAHSYQQLKQAIQIKNQFNLNNMIIHIINSIIDENQLIKFLSEVQNQPVLILGFKKIGKGSKFDPILYNNWSTIFEIAKRNNNHLIFDNLCIEQIGKNKIIKLLGKTYWDRYYLGEEGLASMYIDLVDFTYSTSSIHLEKYELENLNIKQAFKKLKKLKGVKIE